MVFMNKKIQKIIFVLKGMFNYNLISIFKPIYPTEMQINITYSCNSHCQMCNIWKIKPKNELKYEEWEKILKDPIFKNIQKLIIAGGEPFLQPQIQELVKLFIKSMPKLFSITIVTNGFLTERIVFLTERLLKECSKNNIDLNISVSLDGLGKMHNIIRNTPNAFKNTSQTILRLKKIKDKSNLNFFVGVGGLITKINIKEIQEVEKWCKKIDVPFNYQIIGFHKTYVNNLDKKEEIDFTKKEKVPLYTLLKKLSLQYDLKKPRSFLRSYYWQDIFNMYFKRKYRKSPCPFLIDAFVLDSFGDVYYCLSEQKIGNCRKDQNVSKIYFDKRNLEFRKSMKNSSCKYCNSGCSVSSGLVKDFKNIFHYFVRNTLKEKVLHKNFNK